jgi:5-methylthioribose kinase
MSDSGAALLQSLQRMGLLGPGETAPVQALTGGVSSDICRVDLADGPICIKRALARLKVAADWFAPVERNRNEADYLRFAHQVAPGSVPEVLAVDTEGLAFAMPFLDPQQHAVWKNELRDGRVSTEFAAQVGRLLARLHSASARQAQTLSARFATDTFFHALRLEPYLLATAAAHPDLATTLRGLVETTASARTALVHGDVSPKNILCGPAGPVLLDAECAWWGDPAFDLAFCLNHLWLKSVWQPAHQGDYARAFQALAQTYLDGVDWEDAQALESRTAQLLPGLNLARVDGKSPVEYLTEDDQRARVRRAAIALLQRPAHTLAEAHQRWLREAVA